MEERIDFKITLPQDVISIHQALNAEGFDSFLIGGAVRDAYLGVNPKDYDIVTNALPDKVIEILKDKSFVTNILETGKAFGVINVITPDGEYEVATMRKESEYTDQRRPDKVEFTDIQTDILRRDLSYNALFYDIDKEQIVDLVGGINDLNNGITRTVGNATDRFNEDSLRKLRVLRFAARFDSKLDKDITDALIADNSLYGVSPERIRDEFLKGVKTAKSVVEFLKLLRAFNMFKYIFKDLNINPLYFIEERNPIILIATLLNGNLMEEIEPSLVLGKYTSDEINGVKFLSKLYWFSYSDISIFKMLKQRILCKLSDDEIRLFAKYNDMDTIYLDKFLSFKLTVTGADIEKLGIKPGPEMGKKIEELESINFEKHLYR
jgi:translation elongation factor EF-1beta